MFVELTVARRARSARALRSAPGSRADARENKISIISLFFLFQRDQLLFQSLNHV